MTTNNESQLFGRVAELMQQGSKPTDPVKWAKERARIELWSKQQEICQSVVKNKRTAVPSAHGVGKSLTAATLADWWVDTHPIGEAFVVSTAPSAPQIHAILWEEMRRLHVRGNLPGEIQLSDNWIIGKTLVGMGRKPHDYNQHSFQGIHRKYVLVIIDEAAGVPEWLWTAAETITTGEHCRILAIGNPDDPSSVFARVCKPASSWNVIPISAFDSPNFTGEKVSHELADVLTTRGWVEDQRLAWGEDSPLWEAKVCGRFPELDEYAVIPYSWVKAAVNRWREWKDAGMPEPAGRKIVSADVARFGNDKTVFAHRKGNVISHMEEFRKQDTEAVADLIMSRMESGRDLAVVDVIGIGAGVVDKLHRRKVPVRAFNASSRTPATDSTRQWGFPTLRSAAWWAMREALDPSRDSTLCLPDDEQLAADLIAPRWNHVVGAKIYVESKDDIRKRIGRSTDYGDAAIQAMWYSGGPVDDEGGEAVYWTDEPMADGAIPWDEPEEMVEAVRAW